MNILFVVPRYHTNQICWINTLQKNNHNVNMIVSYKSFSEDYKILVPDVLNQSLFSKILRSVFKDQKNKLLFPSFNSILKYAKNRQIDLIIVRDLNRVLSIYSLIIGLILSKKILIYTQTKLYSNITLKKKITLKLLLLNKKIKWVTPIIGDTSKLIQHRKMHFLPFCINNNTKSKDYTEFKTLCVSKFTKRKNLFVLVKLIKYLKENNYKVKIDIIGEVTTNEHHLIYNKLIDLINSENLTNHIYLHKNINHDKIHSFYNKSNLFILPAYNEPASYSVIEAISHHIPVICSDSCGTKYYIENNGEIFISKSYDDLKLKTLKILNNYESYLNGCKEAYNKITPEKFYQNFSEINQWL